MTKRAKRRTKRPAKKPEWKTYEEVAQYLLGRFADHFELGTVEGKQIVAGASTSWEIEAKGVNKEGEGFLIVECRRYKSRLTQESVGGLAFRILDTGASGGIIVSPLPLQSGAQKVAKHSKITHVILSPKSTTTDYLLRFLNQIFIGLSDSVTVTDRLHIEVFRDGKLIDERKT